MDPKSVAGPRPFAPEELQRYARHFSLDGVGEEGQRALARARILLVGAGGLGSPAALYLAAAGVGHLTVVDPDRVDLSNLQRQVLHGTPEVGRPKAASAARRLRALNPEITVEAREEPLDTSNARALVAAHDLVVDGSDNFPTRYLVNDACVLEGRPWVYGAILRWEGQMTVFAAPDGPCYRCLFREPPPPGMVPGCAEAGVLGVLPGIVGSLQALEAIRLVLKGAGRPMPPGAGAQPEGAEPEEGAVGRLLLFDARRLDVRWVHPRRDPACPVCGDDPVIRDLVDYDWFCSTGELRPPGAGPAPGGRVPELGPDELARQMTEASPPLLLDVREDWEWAAGNLAHLGAEHVPARKVADRASDPVWMEEARRRGVVTLCESGQRSLDAAHVLLDAEVDRVAHLAGGMAAWRARRGTES